AFRFDTKILVERAIDAREIEVAVIGNDRPRASVPGEILCSRDFYTYDAKYSDGETKLQIPAQIPESLAGQLAETACRAFRTLDAAGLARVDFLLDRKSQALYVNELNSLPGFTTGSMFPRLWEATGMSFSALLDRLIELGLERHARRSQLAHNAPR
ncbi:MAG: D-alanine--D-alanine ligase, partial [Myxococcota bacterium]|nr:D-alanine--D-alanine ligase [Myxococcota bacterium]